MVRLTDMNQQGLQAEPANCARKSRVAIIGTGLAGLTTAYLVHHDRQKRYEVTLFEQVHPPQNTNSPTLAEVI